jgi:hypothetical protein
MLPFGSSDDDFVPEQVYKAPPDFNTIKYMLEERGIEYEVEDYCIVLKAGRKKVNGYAGFVVFFNFDTKGQLESVDISE